MKQLMQQAQKLQEQMAQFKDKLETMTAEGSAGGGLVKVVVDGHKALQKVTIDPSLLTQDEGEVLEDLIVAAARDAHQKMADIEKEEMQKMTGGMMGGLPFSPFS